MKHKADVIVYGGNSAAVMAAVEVARKGRSVIIVSPDRHMGGLSSGGLGWTDTGNKDVIGGLAREFYHRVFSHYQEPDAWVYQEKEEYGNKGQDTDAIDPENNTMWIFEPHVAEQIFEDFLVENNIQVFREELLDRENGVEKEEGVIKSIRTLTGKVFEGEIFIDATYEGDLMEASKVSYFVGREGCDVYGETWNGIQMDVQHHDHYFKSKISPRVNPVDLESPILPRISAYAPRVQKHGDNMIQAYCYRMCLTQVPENKVEITKPEGYDPSQYELLVRVFDTGWDEFFNKFDPLPNWKTDVNNHGPFSFDNIGMNYDYPKASYERRQEILEEHKRYQQGLLYFVMTDPRVPAEIQDEMKKWGYAKDEFADNDHWPYQIYVREARRMIGNFVMTEHEILGDKIVPRPIGMGSYTVDSHNAQRFITCEGYVQNEGDIGVLPSKPYQIDLGAIMPKEQECKNLLVPVAVSASHTAFGSIRMEPVFMTLAHSGAALATLALEKGCSIYEVSYEDLKARLLEEGQVLTY